MLFEGAEPGAEGQPVTLSYWMNRLQSLPAKHDLFVTLNGRRQPAAEKSHAVFDYAHPLFDEAAFAAQAQMDEIQGKGGYWYAGAWLGWGFHEDALRSGLRVAEALEARPAWARDTIGLAISARRSADSSSAAASFAMLVSTASSAPRSLARSNRAVA